MYYARGRCAVVVCACLATVGSTEAADPGSGREVVAGSGSLMLSSAAMQEEEKTEIRTGEATAGGADWEIDGPVFLRAATPEPPGELIIKNIFGWEQAKEAEEGEDRDEFEYELEVEYGLVEDHELIFEMPWQIGDGRIDGNGDITLGWHWRLWQEDGNWPAFALRNYVRFPSGVDSSGMDYELRGLITKTLVPDCTRLHFNPWGKSVNGDNEEEAEHFQYGIAIGVDHRLRDNLLLIADYLYSSAEEEEENASNHEAELGLDWKLDEHQKLGFALLVGLDGDDDGPEYGATVSYMLSFGE